MLAVAVAGAGAGGSISPGIPGVTPRWTWPWAGNGTLPHWIEAIRRACSARVLDNFRVESFTHARGPVSRLSFHWGFLQLRHPRYPSTCYPIGQKMAKGTRSVSARLPSPFVPSDGVTSRGAQAPSRPQTS